MASLPYNKNGGVSMGISGMDVVLKRLHSFTDETVRQVSGVMREEADDILAQSKEHFVPVDTGALRATGAVTMEDVGDGRKMPVITYGSDVVDYALVVHENPAPYHPVGQWKYLETPLLAAIPGMSKRIAATIRKRMKM